MAAPSNRSPSPVGRANPLVRTPETGSCNRSSVGHPAVKPLITAVRRGVVPVTPANSPADGVRASYERKENDGDRKFLDSFSAKLKSPVVPRGIKNFMAPTISAAFKFTPSPKRQILAERNEPVRTSTTSCVTFEENSELDATRSKSEMGLVYQVVPDTIRISENLSTQVEQAIVNSYTPKNPQTLSKSRTTREDLGHSCLPVLASTESSKIMEDGSVLINGFDHRMAETQNTTIIASEPRPHDYKNVENSHSSPLPISDSTDIDPSLPPYDPDINFLSPRPKFLRYKPNPRIEAFLNKESGFDCREDKSSEDCLNSKSSSVSQTLQGNAETESPPPSSPVKVENGTENYHAELMSDDSDATKEDIEEEENNDVEGAQQKSPCSSARPKFISLLMVLAVLCVSISLTDSPVISSNILNDHPFFHTPMPALIATRESLDKIFDFANTNLEWVSYNLRLWLINFLDYISRMDPFSKGTIGQIYFVNLTVIDTNIIVNQLLKPDADHFHGNRGSEIEADEGGISSKELEVEQETQQEEQVDEMYENEFLNQEKINEEILEEPSQSVAEIQEDHISPDRSKGEIEAASENQEQKLEEPTWLVAEIQNHNSPYRNGSEIEAATEIQEQNHPETEVLEYIDAAVPKERTEAVIEVQEHRMSQDRTEYEVAEANEVPENFKFDPHVDSVEEQINTEHVAVNKARGYLDTIESAIRAASDDLPIKAVLGPSLILLGLTTAATWIFFKKNKGPIVVVPQDKMKKQPLSLEKIKKASSASLTASSHSQPPCIEGSLLGGNPSVDFNVAGESGPLEMSVSSSLEDSMSSSIRYPGRNDAKSHEKKASRSSMISTPEYSDGTSSFGSFTTYEKLQGKNRGGDEEVVTPVRRSSRLRKKITSP